jgi:hypothetical protein
MIAVGLGLISVVGCSENELAARRFDALAVVQGDFDNMGRALAQLEITAAPYNGYIDHATWDDSETPGERDAPGNSVEQLLNAVDENGNLEIDKYNAVFVNSGTRGLNSVVYNARSEPDDAILVDPESLGNACAFVEGGGTLVVSDWAYELVESCFPQRLAFIGVENEPDAAQVGLAGSVAATVRNEALRAEIGDAVLVEFNYTAWAVVTDVGSGVEVLLSGPVLYQPTESGGYERLEDAPLMVRWAEGSGQVVFSSFHFFAQGETLAQALMLYGVPGLVRGAGADSSEVAGG